MKYKITKIIFGSLIILYGIYSVINAELEIFQYASPSNRLPLSWFANNEKPFIFAFGIYLLVEGFKQNPK